MRTPYWIILFANEWDENTVPIICENAVHGDSNAAEDDLADWMRFTDQPENYVMVEIELTQEEAAVLKIFADGCYDTNGVLSNP